MAEAHRDEIAKLEALYASNPEGRVFTHLAEAYRKAGEPDRAREILTGGMKRHPESASAFVVLGRVLSDSGDVTGGFEAFQRALELDTGNLVALRWCGDLAMRAGRMDDALGFYHELMARDPSDDNLRERVAVIENDRAVSMSAPGAAVAPDAVVPNAVPEARGNAVPEARAEPDAADTLHFEPGEQRSGEEYDPSDLPGDLAAFAGRQMESLTGRTWTPESSDAEQAQIAEDEALFADISESMIEADNAVAEDIGLLDLSMDGFAIDGGDAPADVPMPEFGEIALAGDGDAIDVFAETEEVARDAPDAVAFETVAVPDIAPATFDPSEEGPVEEGGFGDAVGGASIAPVTETMAELYQNQGFADRAVDVYRQIIRERGGDARLEQRVSEIEAMIAHAAAPTSAPEEASVGAAPDDLVLEQDASGEMWLKDSESPWTSAEPGGAAHTSPYAWEGHEEEASPSAPIASYFQTLLQWRPGNGTAPEYDDVLLLDEDTEQTPDAPEPNSAPGNDLPWLSEPAPSSLAMGEANPSPESGAAEAPAPLASSSTAAAATLASSSTGAPATPAASSTPAALAAPSADAMPWDATPSAPAADPMPWDAPAAPAMPASVGTTTTNAASNADPVTQQDGPASNQELMPWDTAPAAAMTPPEAAMTAPEATHTETPAAASADSSISAFAPTDATDAGEDDEDLEMFRSWLQSLKK